MATDQLLDTLEIIRRRLCAEGSEGAPNELMAAMLPDGSWADVVYENDHLKDWTAAEHLSRLKTLARGWYRAGEYDDAVLQAVLCGLDAWYARNPRNPNWWWNQIGAPLLLAETLLYIKGHCDRSYIERAIPAFTCHEPVTRFTGQNLVWTATIRAYHGILTDEPERVSLAFALIGKEVHVFPGEEGLQPDMSFFQHEALFYSGGYGQEFAAGVGRLIALCAGTDYAWPAPLVDRFAAYLLDGCRWMVQGRTFDPGACGREISRQGHSAERFYTGLRYLASFAHARQAEAQAAVSGQSPLIGNRHFWCADFMAHHRPGYYLSVRMPSTRVVNADWACCGGEGRLCHHIADGATFILRDGDEYRDIYPVWNWRQIPGATVVQEPGEFDPDTLRGFGEHDFAGGASDGRVGCAAMDFSRAGLSARKAWFFFDEGMVALGTGITATQDAPVRTTLNQCHWRGPTLLAGTEKPLAADEYLLTDGSAFWHDGVTYRIFAGEGTLRLGAQSGAWSDCGVGSPERQTLAVLNAGLDHGVKPVNASYVYAVLPDVDEGNAFTDDPTRFVIVENTPVLQAVWHAGEERGHAVFYEPGVVVFPDGQQIGVDTPCILLYHPGTEGATLTVAQPAQREGMLKLQLKGRITTTVSVSLPTGEYAGSSQTIGWH
ncbi:MAG: polysaccharide lyase family 8 super-sandwich domain-containing protein [Armatimonadota bacterium]